MPSKLSLRLAPIRRLFPSTGPVPVGPLSSAVDPLQVSRLVPGRAPSHPVSPGPSALVRPLRPIVVDSLPTGDPGLLERSTSMPTFAGRLVVVGPPRFSLAMFTKAYPIPIACCACHTKSGTLWSIASGRQQSGHVSSGFTGRVLRNSIAPAVKVCCFCKDTPLITSVWDLGHDSWVSFGPEDVGRLNPYSVEVCLILQKSIHGYLTLEGVGDDGFGKTPDNNILSSVSVLQIDMSVAQLAYDPVLPSGVVPYPPQYCCWKRDTQAYRYTRK